MKNNINIEKKFKQNKRNVMRSKDRSMFCKNQKPLATFLRLVGYIILNYAVTVNKNGMLTRVLYKYVSVEDVGKAVYFYET